MVCIRHVKHLNSPNVNQTRSRRTNKHGISLPCFFIVRLRARCSRTSCTFRALSSSSSTCAPCFVFGQRLTRDTVPPFAIFGVCSASACLLLLSGCGEVLTYFCTLRASFSPSLAFAVCSLASHLFASKKAMFKTYNQAQPRLCFFFVRLWARCSRTFVRSAPCPRLPRLVRLAPRLVNVWQEITTPLRMLAFRDFRRLLCVCLSLVVVRLWRGAHVLRVRSAPCPRLP